MADGTRGGAGPAPGRTSSRLPTVVAQVTFVDGDFSDTVRRAGRLTRQGLFFDLVGGGALVLTLEPGRQLTGEFAGGPDVPARFGSLELRRRGRVLDRLSYPPARPRRAADDPDGRTVRIEVAEEWQAHVVHRDPVRVRASAWP